MYISTRLPFHPISQLSLHLCIPWHRRHLWTPSSIMVKQLSPGVPSASCAFAPFQPKVSCHAHPLQDSSALVILNMKALLATRGITQHLEVHLSRT